MRVEQIEVGKTYRSKAGVTRKVLRFGNLHSKIVGSRRVHFLQGKSPYVHGAWAHVFARWAQQEVTETSDE